MTYDEWFAKWNKESHGRNDEGEAAWDYQQREIDALRAAFTAVPPNKLATTFNPAEWQWQDARRQIFKFEDMTRDDLLQAVCACMAALEQAEAANMEQQKIFSAWRNGRIVDNG